MALGALLQLLYTFAFGTAAGALLLASGSLAAPVAAHSQKSKVKMRSLFFLSTQRLIAFLSPKVNKKEQIKHTNEK